MVKVPQRQTTYADYLYRCVEELIGREGQFTIQTLADYAGLKPTGNMRRRLQHCVEVGTLRINFTSMAHNKGSAIIYAKPFVYAKEFPF